MNIRWALGILFASIFSLGLVGRAAAAPPWASLVPFHKIDADPKKSYALTEDNGPWMILAATFSGEGCEQQAQELVVELRKRYKLEAYTYKRHVDDTKSQIGLGLNKYGEPKRMKPVNPLQFDEVAVMVGDYQSVEDSRAQKTLKLIKSVTPETLDLTKRKTTTQSLAFLRYAQTAVMREAKKAQRLVNSKQAEPGPMRAAMVTCNPLLPEEYFRRGGLDKFVIELNQDFKFSLLNCPGQFTVKVATFRGKDTMLLKEIDKANQNDLVTEKLEVGGVKAHQLVAALRGKGYEAYEFHDRHESVVTIGSFDSLGEPRDDGKIEINPAMHRIIETFKGKPPKTHLRDLSGTALQPEMLGGIAFDVQPTPVAVPRRSIGADYARGN